MVWRTRGWMKALTTNWVRNSQSAPFGALLSTQKRKNWNHIDRGHVISDGTRGKFWVFPLWGQFQNLEISLPIQLVFFKKLMWIFLILCIHLLIRHTYTAYQHSVSHSIGREQKKDFSLSLVFFNNWRVNWESLFMFPSIHHLSSHPFIHSQDVQ